MNANRTASVVVGLIGGVLLLSGCTPTPTPSATPTAPATTPSITTPTTKPSRTPSPDSPEAKIRTTISGYSDFVNRVFTDPTVPATEAGRYVADLAPDYLFVAVQQQISTFRAKGYKQTGTAPISVVSIAAAEDSTYKVAVCQVAQDLEITDAQGQPVEAGPARSSAQYTMVQGKDGVWRIAKIQGTGTAC